jgi:hypothetical protein
MTSETRILALWGGIAGAAAVSGLIWVSARTATLDTQRTRTTQLTSELATSQRNGARLDQQVTMAQHSGQEQSHALDEASAVLVPELTSDYRASDLTSAANRVATDLRGLRQRADRTGVTLPAGLPLESGLDADETVRQMQIAQLFLYRVALETLMEAGVQRISTLQPGRSWADTSGAFAIFTAEIDLEAPYEVLQGALQGFTATHKHGVGVRGVNLIPNPGHPEAAQRSHFTVSLIVPNQSAWKLAPEKSLPAGKSTVSKPVRTTVSASPTKPVTSGSKPGLGDQ